MKVKKTRRIMVGKTPIGGGAPIAVQSMTNTDTRNIQATLQQIMALKAKGCELVRVAVPDMAAARALKGIIAESPLPVIADIHFDYRLALAALESGVVKLRINPGNIGSAEKVRAIVRAAKDHQAAIRIGANAGSLSPEALSAAAGNIPQAMLLSVEEQLRILLAEDFENIIVSLKSSDVLETVEACRLFASRWDFPQHLGITEAGTGSSGVIRSAVGLGILLSEGIGDTIRVSLTGDPTAEVTAAYEILKALRLRQRGPVLISCPTCGRCQIDLARIAQAVEEEVKDLPDPLHLAVMGCVVNGPGEASRADLGLAGGKGQGIIFRHGKVLRRVDEGELLPAFFSELQKLTAEKREEAEGS
ncbi:MAG TPA: flavodoxin-dependent (E)-4-hydroxy-3-methylbut-2-enyl-diphosphate synthase [Bacillota bacterium]